MPNEVAENFQYRLAMGYCSTCDTNNDLFVVYDEGLPHHIEDRHNRITKVRVVDGDLDEAAAEAVERYNERVKR